MTEWNHRANVDELDDPTLNRDERIAKRAMARARRNDADELRLVLAEFLRSYGP